MTLGDTSEVYVKGKVDESDIGKVYLGQTGPDQSRVIQGQNLHRQGDEDISHGRRKGQRHYL